MARHSEERAKIIQILAETPWINLACKRAGISRSAFYRWTKTDCDFRRDVNSALHEGRAKFSEIAEAALMKNVKEGKSGDIHFFLAHNNRRYAEKKANPIQPLTTVEILEFSRIIKRLGSISEDQDEHRDKIINALKMSGFMDSEGRFTDHYYELMYGGMVYGEEEKEGQD